MAIDPATLKLRYPAFAAVPDATVQYWLTDAARIVTDAWGADQEPGTLALAAHSMARANVPGLSGGAVGSLARKGVTSFRSASFSASLDASAVGRIAGTGYSSTDYGAEFEVMLRRNVGGIRLVGCV